MERESMFFSYLGISGVLAVTGFLLTQTDFYKRIFESSNKINFVLEEKGLEKIASTQPANSKVASSERPYAR